VRALLKEAVCFKVSCSPHLWCNALDCMGCPTSSEGTTFADFEALNAILIHSIDLRFVRPREHTGIPRIFHGLT
jgi:hypothetical protein